MADSYLVTVNGAPFATCTTESNAVMLKAKINKNYEGRPADVAPEPLLSNPKHLVALDALAEMADVLGIVPVEQEETAVPTPIRKAPARGKRAS